MHLFNTTLKEGGIPNEWSDGLIIPIHKKGDRLSANNYRGIIISSCMGKIFIKMLTRRIDQHMRARELWKINQCGYKPDHRKINSVKSEILYKSYKTKLTQILKAAEKKHYQDLFRKYKDNMKKSWGIIKRLINRNQVQSYQTTFELAEGQIINDKFAIAKHFNNFFTNIGPNLAKGIPKVDIDPPSYMGESLKETLFLLPVTETEINKIIKALKDSATGHDDISAQFLKLSVDFIVNPLMHICNISLTEGVFPDSLKVANVIPLYKSDDPMYINHYRPVSLLCMLSKVFEKIMYDRLLNFVNKYDLLYAHQYGFRKNRSKYMALLSLVDNLTHALENGEYVVGVYLDFSKAFDTVDHMILLIIAKILPLWCSGLCPWLVH